MMTDPLHIYIDIETIPSRDPAVMREIIAKHATAPLDESTIKPAANLTDPAKIAADLEKRLEKARADQVALVEKATAATDEEYRKTALDGATCHIASISYATGDGEIMGLRNMSLPTATGRDVPSLDVTLGGESVLLRRFFADLEHQIEVAARRRLISRGEHLAAVTARNGGTVAGDDYSARVYEALDRDPTSIVTPVIVAHHASFDVRIIWQRCVVLGIAIPEWWPVDARPWDTGRVDDTMIRWAGATGRISLDKLCRALGLPGKSGFDGSMVWDAVKSGRIDEVVSYCDDDVRRLRCAHRRMIGLELLDDDIYQLIDHSEYTDAEIERDAVAFDAAVADGKERLEGGAA